MVKRKTIKELDEFNGCHCCDECQAIGYNHALKDVLGLLKTDKTKEEIIKEIEG